MNMMMIIIMMVIVKIRMMKILTLTKIVMKLTQTNLFHLWTQRSWLSAKSVWIQWGFCSNALLKKIIQSKPEQTINISKWSPRSPHSSPFVFLQYSRLSNPWTIMLSNEDDIHQTWKCSPFTAFERRGGTCVQGPSGAFLHQHSTYPPLFLRTSVPAYLWTCALKYLCTCILLCTWAPGHQCTMGPLQWEDGIRNFSFLRGIMTILRQTVTFTF